MSDTTKDERTADDGGTDSEEIDRCQRHSDGTIDDVSGEGLWHLEDMGESFAFIVGEGDDRVFFDVRSRDGKVVVEHNE